MTLRGNHSELDVYIDVADNSLSRKWLVALNNLIAQDCHLEKNYCWMGWTESARNAEYLCTQINRSIHAINASDLGYRIVNWFSPANVIQPDLDVDHERMNQLHRYFEDLQGWSGGISTYYQQATPETRWHIRQLNLLCHELENLVLSMRKVVQAPEWRRPSQLMCWLNAPRFALEESDYELFGIDTINRKLGGVYVGVNKAVGKHHWEVFNDEGLPNWLQPDFESRLKPLVTLILNGPVIPALTIGNSKSSRSSEIGSEQMILILRKKLSLLAIRRLRKWILSEVLAPRIIKQSGAS
jgi:hypothetical protein